MPFHVSADPDHRLVRVSYDGPTTIEHRLRALAHGEALLRATGYSRILVDMRQATCVEEPLDRGNHFATRMALSEEVRRCRLAYLVPPHEHSNRLIETMAVARHLDVERFGDDAAALEWLRGDRATPVASDAAADLVLD